MGLRINTNIPSVTALRTLQAAEFAQRKSLERLSTGLRINRAGDDPSGLVISERLRSQIKAMGQALDNSQNASNMMSTTEAALNEVASLLVGIKESIVFALNTGANDLEQIDAEQDAIDNALSSIDRIAATTRFGTRKLLDGGSGLKVTGTAGAVNASDINVQNIIFDSQASQTFTLNIRTLASQATLLFGTAYTGAGASSASIRLSGNLGTQDITIASSFTVAQFDDAINVFTSDTGVFSSLGVLRSVEYGSRESLSLQVLSGTLTGTGLSSASAIQTDTGSDLSGFVNGISFDADGHRIRVVSDALTADIRTSSAVAVGTASTFTVKNSGLTYQLNESNGASDREQVGLRAMQTALLGETTRSVKGMGGTTNTIGGFLSSLESGGTNDLNSNPKNALRIVDRAIDQVSDMRAYLGAFQAQTIDPNIRALSVATENLTASESTIRDLDFAEETANFTKHQILFQSGIAVLAQANLISQSVLTLLG